ncbi:MAG: glucose-6-phosphate isomerase [Gammaproteobacteria bacterium]
MTSDPAFSQVWLELQAHRERTRGFDLRELFRNDPDRFTRFSVEAAGVFLDYSKNRINQETLGLLFDLARENRLDEWIERMFAGDKINLTENRAVLHTALRRQTDAPLVVDGSDIMPAILAVLEKMGRFVEAIHSGSWRGCTGKAITHIVNIGIGGSDLGPRMVVEALAEHRVGAVESRFVANIDGTDLRRALNDLDYASTLFVVASKTFTTHETMTNARSARQWFLEQAGPSADIARHFVAVSTNQAEVAAFGIDPVNMFEFWDWVGGRYSLWSAIGLSIALSIGMEKFECLLKGANAMDEHFRQAPFEANLPVILALIGVWNRNFLGAETCAVLPYDQRLHRFPAYLQQCDMESNGKTAGRDGWPVAMKTGPVLWGEAGTNGQHAFYQLLHQGSDLVSIDFIAALQDESGFDLHHDILIANCFAQAEALMKGKSTEEALTELGKSAAEIDDPEFLARHKTFPGNKPSNMLLIDKLSPQSLGSLIALYEHKIFVQGILWGINSFDQWGVELGKQLASGLLREIEGELHPERHDSSTNGLMRRFKARKDSLA